MSKTLYPNSIRIGLIDPSIAQTWAQRILSDGTTVSSIKRGDTINHTTSQPIATGLFCQRIFGPCTDYTCACGQEKIRIGLNPNISAPVCPDCHVEWTEAAVRRQFLGSIELISPVTHKWFSDSRNYIPTLLGMAPQTFRDLKECKFFFPFSLNQGLSPKKSNPFLYARDVSSSVPEKKVSNFRAMHALQFLIDPKKALNPNRQKRLVDAASFASTGLVHLAMEKTISNYGLTTKKERFFHNQNKFLTESLYRNAQRKKLKFVGDAKDKNFHSLIATTEMLTIEIAFLAKEKNHFLSKKLGKGLSKIKENKENKARNEITNNLLKKKENFFSFDDIIFERKAKHLFKENKKQKLVELAFFKDVPLYLKKQLALLQYVFILAQNKSKKIPLFSDKFLTLMDKNKKVFLPELQSKTLEDNQYKTTVLPVLKTYKTINGENKAKDSKNQIKLLTFPQTETSIFRDFTKYKLKNIRSSLFGKKEKTGGLLVKHSKNWTQIKKVTKIRKCETISNYKIGLLSNSKVGLYRNLSPFTFNLLLPEKNRPSFAKKTLKEKEKSFSYFQCCSLLRTTGTTVWYLKQKETLSTLVLNANFFRFKYYVIKKKKETELANAFWNPFFTEAVSLRNFLSTRPLKKNEGIVKKKKAYAKEHNLPIKPSYTQSEDYRSQFMNFIGKSNIEDRDVPLFSYSSPRFNNKIKKQKVPKPLTDSNSPVLSQEALKINFAKAKAIAKEHKIKEILSQTGGGGLQRFLELINLSELVLILQSELAEIPGPLAKSRMIRRVWLLSLNKFLANFSKALRHEKSEVLEKKLKDIKKEYNNIKKICNSIQKQKNAHKRRYKLAFQLARTMSNPAGMTMSSVPVLPPGLRPIIDIPKIGPITADLNIRYRTLLFALRNLRELAYVDFRNTGAAQASVQEAVDDLLYTGGKTRRDKPSSKNPNLYKSLAMRLKGKHGRFRGNLLGKRVDYSGRSVIVVGPTLKLHQCGLPFEIAIKLFNPFLIRSLIYRGFCKNVYKAKQILLRKKFKPLIWTLCQDLMHEHLILLNRAPTLHRLGVQAFMPILISGRAILLHPLVCTGFNADFDGDQMGVHVPLFPQARAEAWKMMWSRNNFLLPSSGEPVLLPSQDMVLGCYYLTSAVEKTLQLKEQSSILSSPFIVLNPNTALNNYHKGMYGIQSILWINPKNLTSKVNLSKNIKQIPSLTEEIPRIICDQGTQRTLELRITSFGIMRLLHTGGMKSFAFQNSVLLPGRQSLKPPVFSFFIRTTIGRLVFNDLLEEIETS